MRFQFGTKQAFLCYFFRNSCEKVVLTMIITDLDLLPPECKSADFDPAIIQFYGIVKKNFPSVYVNYHAGVRLNNYCGFRPANCTVGAKNSAHKSGKAIDMHLPRQEELQQLRYFVCKYGREWGILRMEAKASTPTWVHVDTMETEKTKAWDYSKGIYVFAP